MTPQEREHRAREAKRIMEDALLIEAFKQVEADTFEELLTTKDWFGSGRRRRAALIDRINTIRDVQDVLRATIAAGNTRQPRAVA